jgi:lysophospholipase L1-like esterase
MWIECPNERSVEDQHSLWQDVNGAIWQLETLQIDYLKFNRYKDHTSPRPEHGPLTHYANAHDTTPIEFTSSSNAGGTPFANPETGKIDFVDYCKRNNLETPDVVYIWLGTNGLMSTEAMTNTRADYAQIVVNKGRKLVGYIKEAFPNVAVKIMGLPNGAPRFGKGCDLPLNDYMDIVHYKKELDLAYQAWCLEDGYKDFMEFINLSGQVDSEYVYPCKEKPVNTRSEVTERVDTNGAHFASAGYMQIADAVFRNFVCSFCKE